jgi:hypothetical protein
MSELRVKSTGTLKLFESDNTSSVTIASPASLGADRTITLPDGDVTLVAGTMSTSSTTINNNADNRVITGSGTANTLEGESSLTYDGTTLQPTTSGGGIKLDNLQSSNANTLDEYEEGDWTCQLHNFSGSETVTSAKYMKIGKLVHCWFSIVTGSFSSDSDAFTIKTLPFTAHNSGDQSVGGCLRAWSTGTNWGSILIGQNDTSAYMYDTTGSAMNYNDFGQSKTLNGCFIYLANS